ncbi:MAG: cytochrome c peroxidase [Planctomycetota bacterium]
MSSRPHSPPGVVLSALLAAWAGGAARSQGLGPPPVPFENPITPQKAILGKVLFFDEQLSSDGTMACATCHRAESGGADPRIGLHPGPDGVRNTPDDGRGSPGVVQSTPAGDYSPHPLFGLAPQVTRRTAPPMIGAAWFNTLRWDGRATETFIDPITHQLRIMADGALESHAAGPPADGGEMAYSNRTWTDIVQRLGTVRPLALATSLPPDLATALAGVVDYGELMRRAYGDRGIDATRVLYALATFQRTLAPDQTPWDRYANGDPNALTPDQLAGLALFTGTAHCVRCHTPPLFSDGSFRNLGLRPTAEDPGWQLATLDPNDRGKFKVPTLRNAGLRNRYMHNGQFTSLAQVVDMYANGGGPFADNRDPQLQPLALSAIEKAQLVEFVSHALTDPRVAQQQPPFDRPLLRSESAPPPIGVGLAGSGGIEPRSIHDAPLSPGNVAFRVGIADGLGGAPAVVAFAFALGPPGQMLGPLPVHLLLQPAPLLVGSTLAGTGSGNGYATLHLPIPPQPGLTGVTLYHQVFVLDPAAQGDLSTSPAAGGVLH